MTVDPRIEAVAAILFDQWDAQERERVVEILAAADAVDPRTEIVRCARGVVRTAHPMIRDEGVIVPEWWDALVVALSDLPEPPTPGEPNTMIRFDRTEDGGIDVVTDRTRASLSQHGWMEIIPALDDALAGEDGLRRCPIDDSAEGMEKLVEALRTIDPPAADLLAALR
jgi:hypothetical protein